MNRKFLNMMLCSLLAGSMATGFVSCKDYDDDITEINTTTGELSQQLQDLKGALEIANAEAAAAKSAAAQANDAASKAAEAGKAAAAEAKADALKELIAQAEMLQQQINASAEKLQQQINANASLSQENAKEIAALVGRIEALEKGLANIDLTEVNKQLGEHAKSIEEANKQIQLLQTQLAALGKYKEQLESLGSSIDEINKKLNAIEPLQKGLEDLLKKAEANEKAIQENAKAIAQNAANIGNNATNIGANAAAIKENKEAIAKLNKALEDISAKITKELGDKINTIAAVISQRLTSVTLMPDLYVHGIPTISFESAKYTKLKFDNKNNKWVKATGTEEYIITNNETQAQYRLNPATVTNEDIIRTEVAYVSRVATSRAAETVNDIVTVEDAKVDGNGILTVKLGKANTGSLNLEEGKINTVALRVPIAEKHLFKDLGETSANVYSEYNQLEETYFKPEIMYVKDANEGTETHPYTDSLEVYKSAPDEKIAKSVVYDETLNLYKLVEGCKLFGDKHEAITIEELRKYGMDINFHVATAPYEPTETDKTNQQEWVKLSGENNSVLTPVTNDKSGNLEDNEAIIGKQPIICATLFDKNNTTDSHNVIDVRYFKVKFTPYKMTPVTFDWTVDVEGTPCGGATKEFTWDEVADKIIVKLNDGKGMSKEDFTKIYGTSSYSVKPENTKNGTFVATVNEELSASIPVFKWSVSKEQLGKLQEGENGPIEYKKTVTFSNAAKLYPDVVINFTFNVKVTVAEAKLGETDPVKWKDNTMLIYVVPMEKPYYVATSPKAHYATNILEGRLKPYVSGLASCAQYDIDFAKGQGYVGEPLSFDATFGHWGMDLTNQNGVSKITYTIANNKDGQKLASEGKTITVEWKSNINGLTENRYTFDKMYLKVLPILNLNPKSAKSITDNSSVQSTTVAVTITDAYGEIVSKTPVNGHPDAHNYWDFYGVEDPTYFNNIQIADDANGANSRDLSTLNMKANVTTDGKITFQNNGAPLQADAYLMVPVQVKHLWGTLDGKIAVPLKKNPNLSTSSVK